MPKKRTPTTPGTAILTARKKADLSQAGLAAKLGISASHLCLIEKGQRAVTITLVAPLCELLKLKPSALLTAQQVAASKAWRLV